MPPRSFTDQLDNQIVVQVPPQRIVSLVPSQTELLYYLGLNDRVVGITRFCAEPAEWRSTKTVVGGTKDFDLNTIEAIHPDLILGNKEENYRDGISKLAQRYPVWMSNIETLDDALAMISRVGEMTDCATQSKSLVAEIEDSLTRLPEIPPKRILYLIWRKPWMAAASGTFIHCMLHLAGFVNCLEKAERYPVLSDQQIRELNPEVVMLSSEPFPFGQNHAKEVKSILPVTKVLLVDGKAFSWYGSRLRHFSDYVSRMLPDLL